MVQKLEMEFHTKYYTQVKVVLEQVLGIMEFQKRYRTNQINQALQVQAQVQVVKVRVLGIMGFQKKYRTK